MPTTKLDAARRLYRKMKHQHELVPFVTFATVTITKDFDLPHLRKQLSRKAKCTLLGLIEQTTQAERPHIHFLSPDHVEKAELRNLLTACLQGQTFNTKVEDIYDPEPLFLYLAKATPELQRRNIPLQCRSVFTIGKVWSKPSAELGKMTDEEIRDTLIKEAAFDNELLAAIMRNELDPNALEKGDFLHWWRRGCRPRPVE